MLWLITFIHFTRIARPEINRKQFKLEQHFVKILILHDFKEATV